MSADLYIGSYGRGAPWPSIYEVSNIHVQHGSVSFKEKHVPTPAGHSLYNLTEGFPASPDHMNFSFVAWNSNYHPNMPQQQKEAVDSALCNCKDLIKATNTPPQEDFLWVMMNKKNVFAVNYYFPDTDPNKAIIQELVKEIDGYLGTPASADHQEAQGLMGASGASDTTSDTA